MSRKFSSMSTGCSVRCVELCHAFWIAGSRRSRRRRNGRCLASMRNDIVCCRGIKIKCHAFYSFKSIHGFSNRSVEGGVRVASAGCDVWRGLEPGNPSRLSRLPALHHTRYPGPSSSPSCRICEHCHSILPYQVISIPFPYFYESQHRYDTRSEAPQHVSPLLLVFQCSVRARQSGAGAPVPIRLERADLGPPRYCKYFALTF
jgi:hypothetical protein